MGELGLDEYHSELLPADKVEHVERAEGRSLAFVGDGINDAPVLARADVGIAMGAMGSDAAIEAADVTLIDDMPSRVAASVRIARRTLGMARQNIAFAIAVKVAVLLLAGSASPRCGSPSSATWASWCSACSTPPAHLGEVRDIPVPRLHPRAHGRAPRPQSRPRAHTQVPARAGP